MKKCGVYLLNVTARTGCSKSVGVSAFCCGALFRYCHRCSALAKADNNGLNRKAERRHRLFRVCGDSERPDRPGRLPALRSI